MKENIENFKYLNFLNFAIFLIKEMLKMLNISIQVLENGTGISTAIQIFKN